MKLIVAIIQPEKLEAVQEALDTPDVRVMYAGEVADVRHQRSNVYRGVQFRVSPPKLRLEVLIVNEEVVSEIVDSISRAAFNNKSGLYGSGDLFVLQLDEWIPIRAATANQRPARGQEPSPVADPACVSQ